MKQVDFLFLSDADFTVLGCLPYLHKNGLLKSAQIFATSPVAKLGAQALFEFLI
jgi:Cft2 family RNA processing exonuclease